MSRVSILHARLMVEHIIQRDRVLLSASAADGTIHWPKRTTIISLTHQQLSLVGQWLQVATRTGRSENSTFRKYPWMPRNGKFGGLPGHSPPRNHPARFSVGSWRGENLKFWRANFAGLDFSFSAFQLSSFPGFQFSGPFGHGENLHRHSATAHPLAGPGTEH